MTAAEWTAAVAIGVSVGTLVLMIVKGRSEVTQMSVLTSGELQSQIRALAKDLAAERDARRKLEKAIDLLASEVRSYEIGVAALAVQIERLGAEPVWTPPVRGNR